MVVEQWPEDAVQRDAGNPQAHIDGATYDCALCPEHGVWKLDGIAYTEGQLLELAG